MGHTVRRQGSGHLWRCNCEWMLMRPCVHEHIYCLIFTSCSLICHFASLVQQPELYFTSLLCWLWCCHAADSVQSQRWLLSHSKAFLLLHSPFFTEITEKMFPTERPWGCSAICDLPQSEKKRRTVRLSAWLLEAGLSGSGRSFYARRKAKRRRCVLFALGHVWCVCLRNNVMMVCSRLLLSSCCCCCCF